MADDSADFDSMGPTDVLGSTAVAESMTSTANLPTDLITDVATSSLFDADAATVSLTRQCPKCGLMFSSEYERCPVDNHALEAISAGLGGSLMARELSEADLATDRVDAFDETDVQRVRDAEILGPANDETIRGTVLDKRFFVEELIGEGGMGRVYRGSQLSVGRAVAIKMLHRRISNEPSIRERFNREARIVSGFSHPNTVRVIDFGEASGHLYMVMELVDGVSLQRFVGRGPMSVPFALELLRQVCGPLAEAHKADVVHRDLKPENLVIARTADGRLQIKLLDFGVAHIDPSSAEEQADTYRELTRQGVVVGTPEYMAPEQARGEGVTKTTDVYALGVILYQMISGHLPFAGQTPMHTMFQLVTKPVPPITDYVPGCPLPIVELVEQLLQKDPERRIKNVVAVARRLREVRLALGLQPLAELPDGDLRAVLEALVYEDTAVPVTNEYRQPPRGAVEAAEPPADRATVKNSRPAAVQTEDSDAFDEDAPTAVVNASDVKVLRDSQPQAMLGAPPPSEAVDDAEASGPNDPAPDRTPQNRSEPVRPPAEPAAKVRTKPLIEPTAEVATSSRPNPVQRTRKDVDPTQTDVPRPYVPPNEATVIAEAPPSRARVLILTAVVFIFVAAAGGAIFKFAAEADEPDEAPEVDRPLPQLPPELTKSPRTVSNPPVVPPSTVTPDTGTSAPDLAPSVDPEPPKPKEKARKKSTPKAKPPTTKPKSKPPPVEPAKSPTPAEPEPEPNPEVQPAPPLGDEPLDQPETAEPSGDVGEGAASDAPAEKAKPAEDDAVPSTNGAVPETSTNSGGPIIESIVD